MQDLFSKKQLQYTQPFTQPVRILYPSLQDYHQVIEQPMDLGTIRDKLTSRCYTTLDEFLSDFMLMFHNCYQYNEKHGGYILKQCQKVQNTVEKRFATISKGQIYETPAMPSAMRKMSLQTKPRPTPPRRPQVHFQEQPQVHFLEQPQAQPEPQSELQQALVKIDYESSGTDSDASYGIISRKNVMNNLGILQGQMDKMKSQMEHLHGLLKRRREVRNQMKERKRVAAGLPPKKPSGRKRKNPENAAKVPVPHVTGTPESRFSASPLPVQHVNENQVPASLMVAKQVIVAEKSINMTQSFAANMTSKYDMNHEIDDLLPRRGPGRPKKNEILFSKCPIAPRSASDIEEDIFPSKTYDEIRDLALNFQKLSSKCLIVF